MKTVLSPTLDDRLVLAGRHPHDFTLQYPPRREYFGENFRAPVAPADLLRDAREMLLYCHVPFCEAKCYYCNFAVDIRSDEILHARYVEAVCQSLRYLETVLPADGVIPGIDIGGGTPTRLSAPLLQKLLHALKPWRVRAAQTTRFPLSIETTPRIAAFEPEKMAMLAENGVDRVSVGLQSTHSTTLQSVNRREQTGLYQTALKGLRTAGFGRVSADLIFGLPQQTETDWRDDLMRVSDQPVDTITTYDCLYRGKGRALTRRTPDLPEPETYRRLYDAAYETLTQRGFFTPYGSVNFSRHEGETGVSAYFEARLLNGTPYIGLGNYASSLMGDFWWFAPYGVNAFLDAADNGDFLPVGDSYRLPAEERMAKYVLLSLSFGVLDARRFARAFHGVSLEAAFPDALHTAVERGWLRAPLPGQSTYTVAPGAFGNLPQVRALFYAPGAISWLLAREGMQSLKIVSHEA